MGSREDDDYWNDKYAEASCWEHGPDYMTRISGEWLCANCEGDEEDEEDE